MLKHLYRAELSALHHEPPWTGGSGARAADVATSLARTVPACGGRAMTLSSPQSCAMGSGERRLCDGAAALERLTSLPPPLLHDPALGLAARLHLAALDRPVLATHVVAAEDSARP